MVALARRDKALESSRAPAHPPRRGAVATAGVAPVLNALPSSFRGASSKESIYDTSQATPCIRAPAWIPAKDGQDRCPVSVSILPILGSYPASLMAPRPAPISRRTGALAMAVRDVIIGSYPWCRSALAPSIAGAPKGRPDALALTTLIPAAVAARSPAF